MRPRVLGEGALPCSLQNDCAIKCSHITFELNRFMGLKCCWKHRFYTKERNTCLNNICKNSLFGRLKSTLFYSRKDCNQYLIFIQHKGNYLCIYVFLHDTISLQESIDMSFILSTELINIHLFYRVNKGYIHLFKVLYMIIGSVWGLFYTSVLVFKNTTISTSK